MSVFRSLLVGLAMVAGSSTCFAENLRLHSTNAMQQPMGVLIPDFEKSTGHKVQAIFEPTAAILERLKVGEPCDLVFLIKGGLQGLKQSGFVRAETETELASVSMGVAVREGTPVPDLSSVKSFQDFLKSTPTIVVSRVGASGVEFTKALDRNNVGELKSRLVQSEGATPTAEAVARGEGALAVQMISELKAVKGVIVVGPLPGDFHFQITVSSAIAAQASPGASMAAADLVRFLATPEARQQLRDAGMVPL